MKHKLAKVMKTEISSRFRSEHLKIFNRESVEQSLDTQERLYVVSLSRVNELKADICRYIISILDDSERTYFLWDQAAINARLITLSKLGYDEAIDKFFEYGYWT